MIDLSCHQKLREEHRKAYQMHLARVAIGEEGRRDTPRIKSRPQCNQRFMELGKINLSSRNILPSIIKVTKIYPKIKGQKSLLSLIQPSNWKL